MKKLAFLILSFILIGSSLQAQYVFEKGDIAINAGLGLGGYDGFIPSIEASVEFGAIPTGDIGLVSFGGSVGYKYANYGYLGFSDYHYNKFQFGVRGAWHLHTFKSDKYDVYAGLGLGMVSYADYDFVKDDYVTSFHLSEEVFVGGRMMFSEAFGAFAEVGYGHLSNLRVGLTFKL